MGKISFPEEAKRFPLEIQSSLRKPKAFQNNSNLSRRAKGKRRFSKENQICQNASQVFALEFQGFPKDIYRKFEFISKETPGFPK